MTRQTQYSRIEKLLTRKSGATAMEIIAKCGTTCPHKRLSELKERGWFIQRLAVKGQTYGRYVGQAPA